MKATTLTKLRGNLFNLVDQIINTGKPIYIKRKGHIIKIDLNKPLAKTNRLFNEPVRKNVINGDPNELVNFKSWHWNDSA